MPRLYNKQNNALLGDISESDVECLVDVLEDNGASAGLLKFLRGAIGAAEGVDVRWEK